MHLMLQSLYSRTSIIQWNAILLAISVYISGCAEKSNKENLDFNNKEKGCKLIILGTTQDGGSPHIGCKKNCCKELFINSDNSRKVVSLGLIDFDTKRTYLFEATPDISAQLKYLKKNSSFMKNEVPDGIFLTHAHIGHYAGLMYLGKEAMNSVEALVYSMPRMKLFLETNGPWSQLVKLKNIQLKPIIEDSLLQLNKNFKVEALKVPHRDEYSETTGFKIVGPNKKVLFIPDIDKWEKWHLKIEEEIKKVDFAFLDATFYDGNEIANRDMSQIPHPFVVESIERFKKLSKKDKSKIYFIHFNHTNPLLDSMSLQSLNIKREGFHAAQPGQMFDL